MSCTPLSDTNHAAVCSGTFAFYYSRQVSYCIKNGWKQQIHCVEAYASNETQNYIDAESTSYYTYQPCPISFDRFVRLETFMLLCAVFALFYVQRRKRWLVKIQQYRISAF